MPIAPSVPTSFDAGSHRVHVNYSLIDAGFNPLSKKPVHFPNPDISLANPVMLLQISQGDDSEPQLITCTVRHRSHVDARFTLAIDKRQTAAPHRESQDDIRVWGKQFGFDHVSLSFSCRRST
jgi:hypothetical protein